MMRLFLGLALLCALGISACDKPLDNSKTVPSAALGQSIDPHKMPALTSGCVPECGDASACEVGNPVCQIPHCNKTGCAVCEVTIAADFTYCDVGTICCYGGATGSCDGACALTCTGTNQNCNGSVEDGCEVDIGTTATSCGTCTNNCNAKPNVTAATCSSSQCHVTTCAAGFADCNGQGSDGCEINKNTDKKNCGACGTDCTALPNVTGAVACVSGQCVIGGTGCTAGHGNCDGNVSNGCEADLTSDKNNCSACGTVCSSNNVTSATCSGSVCTSACSANFADCDGNKQSNGCESSLQTEVAHCGACGTPCSGSHISAVCSSASCESGTCTGTFADCNGDKRTDGCEIDLASDADHCGGCATVCSSNNMATRTCGGSACNGACAANFADCDSNKQTNGCEINVKTDAANCNGCGMPCSSNHVTPSCGGGACNGACDGNYGDCNGDKRADGCETDLRVTIAACGSCGFDCRFKEAHISQDQVNCTASICGYSGACDVGWGDCDGNAANACETSLLTSPSSCGTCGHACTAPSGGTAVCVNGTCDFTCNGGLQKCADSCAACCSDGDCRNPPDANDKCTVGKCNAGACEYKPKSCVTTDCFSGVMCIPATGECKGTPLTGNSCGQAGCCEAGGTCQDGACQCTGGKGKDCTTGLGPCEKGLCSSLGACEKETLPNDTPCSIADKCQVATACSNGECIGTPKTCTPSGQCKTSACESGTGNCVEGNATAGLPCSTDNSCIQNEACNASGACVGTTLPDQTPCTRSDCPSGDLVICMSGTCSCVQPPDMAMGAADLSVEGGGDLAGADLGGKPPHKGCAAVPGVPPLEALLLCMLVALFLRRRPRAR